MPNTPHITRPRLDAPIITAHRLEGAIRADRTLTGRAAYEASCAILPRYSDGTPRRSWDELDDIARWSWERPPA